MKVILLLAIFLISGCTEINSTSGYRNTKEEMEKEYPEVKGCSNVKYIDKYRDSEISKVARIMYSKRCVVTNENLVSEPALLIPLILMTVFLIFIIVGVSKM